MFNRDQDGAEDLASDQSFPWPPPGFRDRRTHFGRTADPASSASSFGTPHRKSSDQVIQSLRDELDKHRQMFFDRLAPQWEPTGHRVRVAHISRFAVLLFFSLSIAEFVMLCQYLLAPGLHKKPTGATVGRSLLEIVPAPYKVLSHQFKVPQPTTTRSAKKRRRKYRESSLPVFLLVPNHVNLVEKVFTSSPTLLF